MLRFGLTACKVAMKTQQMEQADVEPSQLHAHS